MSHRPRLSRTGVSLSSEPLSSPLVSAVSTPDSAMNRHTPSSDNRTFDVSSDDEGVDAKFGAPSASGNQQLRTRSKNSATKETTTGAVRRGKVLSDSEDSMDGKTPATSGSAFSMAFGGHGGSPAIKQSTIVKKGKVMSDSDDTDSPRHTRTSSGGIPSAARPPIDASTRATAVNAVKRGKVTSDSSESDTTPALKPRVQPADDATGVVPTPHAPAPAPANIIRKGKVESDSSDNSEQGFSPKPRGPPPAAVPAAVIRKGKVTSDSDDSSVDDIPAKSRAAVPTPAKPAPAPVRKGKVMSDSDDSSSADDAPLPARAPVPAASAPAIRKGKITSDSDNTSDDDFVPKPQTAAPAPVPVIKKGKISSDSDSADAAARKPQTSAPRPAPAIKKGRISSDSDSDEIQTPKPAVPEAADDEAAKKAALKVKLYGVRSKPIAGIYGSKPANDDSSSSDSSSGSSLEDGSDGDKPAAKKPAVAAKKPVVGSSAMSGKKPAVASSSSEESDSELSSSDSSMGGAGSKPKKNKQIAVRDAFDDDDGEEQDEEASDAESGGAGVADFCDETNDADVSAAAVESEPVSKSARSSVASSNLMHTNTRSMVGVGSDSGGSRPSSTFSPHASRVSSAPPNLYLRTSSVAPEDQEAAEAAFLELLKQDWVVMVQQVFESAGLTAGHFERFTSALKQETFHNGDFVVRQGDIGDRFFIIESGEVSIEELKAGQDERTVLTTLYAGGHFGEYSLLREQPRMASVIARSPVVAHSLDRVSFQTLCSEDPAFEAVIKELVAETDATRKKREELLAKQRNATTLRFVRGNKSDTRVTHTVERSRTLAKEEMINHYVIGRQLGSGSYGKVFICTDTVDDTKWALKQVDKAKLRRKRIGLTDEELMREVEVMKKLQHENLVKLREVINDPKTNQLYMVQEFCHEGSVMPEAEYAEPLDPEYARELFRDVVKGLEYLHFQRIIHRDMKPSNVFLASPADSSSKIAKIGDFGSSIFLRTDDDMISDVAGSPAFMAPELWVEKPYFSGRAADIWALGATLYNMVVGHPPFMANSEKELIARLENPLDEPIYPREVSPPLRNLLRRMLNKNFRERIKLSEIISHAWVTSEGTVPLPRQRYVRIDIGDDDYEESEIDDLHEAYSGSKAMRNSTHDLLSPPSSHSLASSQSQEGSGGRGSTTPLDRLRSRGSLPKMGQTPASVLVGSVGQHSKIEHSRAPTNSMRARRASLSGGQTSESAAQLAAESISSGIKSLDSGRRDSIRGPSFPPDDVLPAPLGLARHRSSTIEQKPTHASPLGSTSLRTASRRGSVDAASFSAEMSRNSMNRDSIGSLPHSETSANLHHAHSNASNTVSTSVVAAAAAKKLQLQQMRKKQLQLIKGHSALPDDIRDTLMDQQRFAIHEARAEAVVEDFVLEPEEGSISPRARRNSVAAPLPHNASAPAMSPTGSRPSFLKPFLQRDSHSKSFWRAGGDPKSPALAPSVSITSFPSQHQLMQSWSSSSLTPGASMGLREILGSSLRGLFSNTPPTTGPPTPSSASSKPPSSFSSASKRSPPVRRISSPAKALADHLGSHRSGIAFSPLRRNQSMLPSTGQTVASMLQLQPGADNRNKSLQSSPSSAVLLTGRSLDLSVNPGSFKSHSPEASISPTSARKPSPLAWPEVHLEDLSSDTLVPLLMYKLPTAIRTRLVLYLGCDVTDAFMFAPVSLVTAAGADDTILAAALPPADMLTAFVMARASQQQTDASTPAAREAAAHAVLASLQSRVDALDAFRADEEPPAVRARRSSLATSTVPNLLSPEALPATPVLSPPSDMPVARPQLLISASTFHEFPRSSRLPMEPLSSPVGGSASARSKERRPSIPSDSAAARCINLRNHPTCSDETRAFLVASISGVNALSVAHMGNKLPPMFLPVSGVREMTEEDMAKRKLTRREDFVLVTEHLSSSTQKGNVKRAVIFKARNDAGGSLSIANASRGLGQESMKRKSTRQMNSLTTPSLKDMAATNTSPAPTTSVDAHTQPPQAPDAAVPEAHKLSELEDIQETARKMRGIKRLDSDGRNALKVRLGGGPITPKQNAHFSFDDDGTGAHPTSINGLPELTPLSDDEDDDESDASDVESDFGSLMGGGENAFADVTDTLDAVLDDMLAQSSAVDNELEPLDDVVFSLENSARGSPMDEEDVISDDDTVLATASPAAVRLESAPRNTPLEQVLEEPTSPQDDATDLEASPSALTPSFAAPVVPQPSVSPGQAVAPAPAPVPVPSSAPEQAPTVVAPVPAPAPSPVTSLPVTPAPVTSVTPTVAAPAVTSTGMTPLGSARSLRTPSSATPPQGMTPVGSARVLSAAGSSGKLNIGENPFKAANNATPKPEKSLLPTLSLPAQVGSNPFMTFRSAKSKMVLVKLPHNMETDSEASDADYDKATPFVVPSSSARTQASTSTTSRSPAAKNRRKRAPGASSSMAGMPPRAPVGSPRTRLQSAGSDSVESGSTPKNNNLGKLGPAPILLKQTFSTPSTSGLPKIKLPSPRVGGPNAASPKVKGSPRAKVASPRSGAASPRKTAAARATAKQAGGSPIKRSATQGVVRRGKFDSDSEDSDEVTRVKIGPAPVLRQAVPTPVGTVKKGKIESDSDSSDSDAVPQRTVGASKAPAGVVRKGNVLTDSSEEETVKPAPARVVTSTHATPNPSPFVSKPVGAPADGVIRRGKVESDSEDSDSVPLTVAKKSSPLAPAAVIAAPVLVGTIRKGKIESDSESDATPRASPQIKATIAAAPVLLPAQVGTIRKGKIESDSESDVSPRKPVAPVRAVAAPQAPPRATATATSTPVIGTPLTGTPVTGTLVTGTGTIMKGKVESDSDEEVVAVKPAPAALMPKANPAPAPASTASTPSAGSVRRGKVESDSDEDNVVAAVQTKVAALSLSPPAPIAAAPAVKAALPPISGVIKKGKIESDSEDETPTPKVTPPVTTPVTTPVHPLGKPPIPTPHNRGVAPGAVRKGKVESDSDSDGSDVKRQTASKTPAPVLAANVTPPKGKFDSDSERESGSGTERKLRKSAVPILNASSAPELLVAQHLEAAGPAIHSASFSVGGRIVGPPPIVAVIEPGTSKSPAELVAPVSARSSDAPVEIPYIKPKALPYQGIGEVLAPSENINDALGIRFGVAEDQGKRSTMEDRCMALIDMNSALNLPESQPTCAYFGVYDGHNGDECASMLSRRLHVNIAKLEAFASDVPTALVQAFVKTDRIFLRRQIDDEKASAAAAEAAVAAKMPPPPDFKFSGSTALAIVARKETVFLEEARDYSTVGSGDEGEEEQVEALRLYIAHSGDCRAVLSHAGVAVDMTHDHKANTRPDEVERIEAAGGWVHNGRLHGVLAVTRAFGDVEHKVLKERFWDKEFNADPLIVEPDIRVHTVSPRDEFMVIACDGLWDVLTSQQVVNFVRRKLREHGDVQTATEQLVQKALALNSVDNVTAFIICFNQVGILDMKRFGPDAGRVLR